MKAVAKKRYHVRKGWVLLGTFIAVDLVAVDSLLDVAVPDLRLYEVDGFEWFRGTELYACGKKSDCDKAIGLVAEYRDSHPDA